MFHWFFPFKTHFLKGFPLNTALWPSNPPSVAWPGDSKGQGHHCTKSVGWGPHRRYSVQLRLLSWVSTINNGELKPISWDVTPIAYKLYRYNIYICIYIYVYIYYTSTYNWNCTSNSLSITLIQIADATSNIWEIFDETIKFGAIFRQTYIMIWAK